MHHSAKEALKKLQKSGFIIKQAGLTYEEFKKL